MLIRKPWSVLYPESLVIRGVSLSHGIFTESLEATLTVSVCLANPPLPWEAELVIHQSCCLYLTQARYH